MTPTKDAFTEEQATSSSFNWGPNETERDSDVPFVSLREFTAQIPDLTTVGEQYLRGEITRKDVMNALRGLNDHLTALRERETEFLERERRGEVTSAERQKEYGWTDEELEILRNDMKIRRELVSHNVARCRDRILLYSNSRGH